jgi:hypothetical protein
MGRDEKPFAQPEGVKAGFERLAGPAALTESERPLLWAGAALALLGHAAVLLALLPLVSIPPPLAPVPIAIRLVVQSPSALAAPPPPVEPAATSDAPAMGSDAASVVPPRAAPPGNPPSGSEDLAMAGPPRPRPPPRSPPRPAKPKPPPLAAQSASPDGAAASAQAPPAAPTTPSQAAIYRVLIDREGKILRVDLAQSSGSDSRDQAGRAAILATGTLKRPPYDLAGDAAEMFVELPLNPP